MKQDICQIFNSFRALFLTGMQNVFSLKVLTIVDLKLTQIRKKTKFTTHNGSDKSEHKDRGYVHVRPEFRCVRARCRAEREGRGRFRRPRGTGEPNASSNAIKSGERRERCCVGEG